MVGLGDDAAGPQQYRPFAPDSGALGRPLPDRADLPDGYDLDWNLRRERAGKRRDHPVVLHRYDSKTGERQWVAKLPWELRGWLRDDDRLLVHVTRGGQARGLLVSLDMTTGELTSVAHAPRGLTLVARSGDLIVATTNEAVVAFAAEELGPPEAELFPVAEEVDRILAAVDRREVPTVDDGAVQEILDLGRAALPVLERRYPALGLPAAMTAAATFGQARYRRAAPLVAALLRDLRAPGEEAPYETLDRREDFRSSVFGSLVVALGRIGGAEEVDEVGDVLLDEAMPDPVRHGAALALAEIGLPESLSWLDRFAAIRRNGSAWWSLPDPAPWLVELGEAPEASVSDDQREWVRSHANRAAIVADGDSRILVFPAGTLGGGDLWAARLRSNGPDALFFLGIAVEELAGGGAYDSGIEASLEGTRLWVAATGGQQGSRIIDLALVEADTDGDGITDVAERRLGTNPRQSDTDEDGVPDSADAAPGGGAAPTGEEDEIRRAIVLHHDLFDDRYWQGPRCIVSDRLVEWEGSGRRPLLSRPEGSDDSQCLTLDARPAAQVEGALEAAEGSFETEEGDRVWVLHEHQGWHAKATFYVVRQVAGRWLVRLISLWWIT